MMSAGPPDGAGRRQRGGPRTLADRYRLDRPLAFGGMAEVWIATDVVLDRKVAVKVLRPELAADPLLVERFRREAMAAARLNHPNIVSLFDSVSEDGLEAVVLEFVPGRTLRHVLDDEGRLSISDTVHIGIALADALDAAHRGGLVHRDVKPGNVLITPSRRVMLTDFGIATALGRTTDITHENVMQGTAKYLSPEQVLGAPTDGRSDLYSLGIMLYECLTGRVPFEAESDAATALARLQSDARPLRTLRPGVPRVLDELVCSCLTRSPDGRPSTGADVRDALVRMEGTVVDDGRLVIERDPTPSGVLPHLPVVTSVETPAKRKRRPGRWTTAFAVVLFLGVAVGVAGALLTGADPGRTTTARPGNVRPASDDLPTIEASTTTAATRATTSTMPPSPASGIAGTQEFDPPPGDGTENPDLLPFLTDGKPSTVWKTLCYDNAGFAPKPGVGIVFRLSEPAAGKALSVTSTSSGWTASVYVASAPATTLKGWGTKVAVGKDIPAGRVDFPLGDSDGTYALLWIIRLGPLSSCELPFGLTIADVRVIPMPGQ